MRKEFICYAIFLIVVVMISISQIKEERERNKVLEQSNKEQIEEKEVYVRRCKMLEDLMIENGIAVDDCDCR